MHGPRRLLAGALLAAVGIDGAMAAGSRGAGAAPSPAATTQSPSSAASTGPLGRQARALQEQDTAIALEKLGRSADAIAHYRAAIASDASLKTPWANLAVHALAEGTPEQAVHLASVAQYLDPRYETARGVLEEALGSLPPPEKRGEGPRERCAKGDRAQQQAGGTGTGGAAAWDETGGLRSCLERQAGWLGGTGAQAAGPLKELARLDLEAGRVESSALLLGIAATLETGGEAPLLAQALDRAGDPCAAAAVAAPGGEGRSGDPSAPYAGRCETLRAARARAEALIGASSWSSLDEGAKAASQRRLETFLLSGMSPEQAAARWWMERRRGGRTLIDLGPVLLRLGDEWFDEAPGEGEGFRVWRRRPGDSLLAAVVLGGAEGTADEALRRLLASRKPAPMTWSPAAFAATDAVTARSSPLSLDTNAGGRAEGTVWLIESPAAPGRALVLLTLPGTGGLGAEGLEQARAELSEAIETAVAVPPRWAALAGAGGGEDDFPVPLVRDRAADERESPWRTFPLGGTGFSIALPPGTVAAPPAAAPPASAPGRPQAALWFRGRFLDRDGILVAIGDEGVAASVDVQVTSGAGPSAPGTVAALAPPAADPGASPIAALDAAPLLGADTGASQVLLGRFRPSAGRPFEWVVARLVYTSRIVELAMPVFSGARSLALYWIPSTLRTAQGTPPPAPLDLMGRLGITFLRPPPTERREAFYKEGDLRSRDFTMIVPRGFYVGLNTASIEAFPARISHRDGGAVAVLDRLPTGAGAEPASEATLGAAVRDWLAREGFVLEGTLATGEYARAAKLGATRGLEASFTVAERKETGGAGAAGTERAAGRAWLLEARDGRAYVLMSICWGKEQRLREDDLRLMLGSLRLQKP